MPNGVEQLPAAAPAGAARIGNDHFPSGSWGLGPLNIQWSIKDLDEVDVDVSILGIDIDHLSGTIDKGKLSIGNHVSVLGLISGDLEIEAIHDQGVAADGLWLEGQLAGIGFNTGPLMVRLFSWP